MHNPATIGAGALQGVKVLDLSRILGGPFCGQILGDHGADVLKVEPPQGDDTRTWGPPFRDGVASYYFGLNRNKRLQFLDLSAPEGQQRVRALMAEADVVVENFKVGTMEKWGIGYEQMREELPHLIWCRVTGFGADGPLGSLPGYDAAIQAMAGIMSINGEADGDPLRVGLPVVDMVTGLNATIGVLLALHERGAADRGNWWMPRSTTPGCRCSIPMRPTGSWGASCRSARAMHIPISIPMTFSAQAVLPFSGRGQRQAVPVAVPACRAGETGAGRALASAGQRSVHRAELKPLLEQAFAP
jgi:hypothetical protein